MGYNKKWYDNHSDRQIEFVRRNKQRLAQWLHDYKSNLSCETCEESAIECLEFHHINPLEKEHTIAHCIRDGWSIIRIQKEIEKCKVLCANCHRKLHASMV